VSEIQDQIDSFSVRDLLRSLPIFSGLDELALAALEQKLEWFSLPGGAPLFDIGDRSDAMYVLKNGSLGVFGHDAKDLLQRVAVIAAGETVGEVGLIADQPRHVSVRALRDSELLRLARVDVEDLLARYPQAMWSSVRVAMQRVLAHRTHTPSAPRTFALLPHDAGVDACAFAEELRIALSGFGACAVVDAAKARHQLSEWFSALESRVQYVIYLADGNSEEWRALCVRQADCLLLLANAASPASAWPEGACEDAEQALHRPRHLVLLHLESLLFGAAQRWLDVAPNAQHHHVRQRADTARVARLLAGRGIGLVLSGGGARGFAHIGVIKALREAGITIDRVGGTSIGAIIGAGIAADWTTEEMIAVYKRAFVDGKPLRDYTFPWIAMVTGRRSAHLLREAFGRRDIADLVLPYFCVSANLTSGKIDVRRHGPLWLWLRASSAIPGILPPVLHHGEVFVDGAVINNLPVDVMRAQGVGEVIAVDISADDILHAKVEEYASPSWWRLFVERKLHQRPHIFSILLRSGMVNAEVASIERRALTSLLLTPPLHNIELLNWRAYKQAIQAGYDYTVRVLDDQNREHGAEAPLFDGSAKEDTRDLLPMVMALRLKKL
jgi:NTE family protein